MEYLLGDRIKDLREHLKMSQRALCKDICTQGLISRIENNTAIPTAPLLHQIAIKLGVDSNYFFDDISSHGYNYVKEVMNTIDKHIGNCEYQEVMNIVKQEKVNPLFNKRHLQQYLYWREGICTYYLHKDREKALELLNKSLYMGTLQNQYTETEIDILASQAIIYSLSGDLEHAAEIYKSLLRNVDSLLFVRDKRLVIRILYNASVNSYERKEYEEALKYIDKAYNTCIEEDQLYLFGHILFQKGCALFRYDPSKRDTCIELLKEALWIYELKPVPEFIAYLKEEMKIMTKS
ncbi:helix-turn-helix domain-containing protein [Alkalihalobacterium chitinilyticum]|uniref:Helix-turn-helix transcriptional regulator n=1 Tax=Alkalihalobacterium chitinilyticum TaxID=2980103 RepID=A0ABT5VIX2_9BACI|nr:helix-turn-helix domain-containing protein [Alkalihalobacterium chitinilyticum]MDE5415402.1 helix-turn-helix transcriptional regulator [Alkalihalobacterium chitinilyticum]